MWKDVPSYEDKYEASTDGHIRDKKTKELLKEFHVLEGDKHLYVYLTHNNTNYQVALHRVIASTFVPNYSMASTVHHKDFNPKNNKPSNLIWTSTSYNVALGNGRQPYVTRLYSKGSNLVKTYYTRTELVKDLGATDRDSSSVWEYLLKYLIDNGNREYTMSEVTFNYLKNGGYQKYIDLVYPAYISEVQSGNAKRKRGTGKVQKYLSSLTPAKLAQIKEDVNNLSQSVFKNTYGLSKQSVKYNLENN